MSFCVSLRFFFGALSLKRDGKRKSEYGKSSASAVGVALRAPSVARAYRLTSLLFKLCTQKSIVHGENRVTPAAAKRNKNIVQAKRRKKVMEREKNSNFNCFVLCTVFSPYFAYCFKAGKLRFGLNLVKHTLEPESIESWHSQFSSSIHYCLLERQHTSPV